MVRRRCDRGIDWDWQKGCISVAPAIWDSNAHVPDDDAVVSANQSERYVVGGETLNALIALFNFGRNAWKNLDGYRLGAQHPQDNMTWEINRVDLRRDTSPGRPATFEFEATAPLRPGRYKFAWQMVHKNVGWFGEIAELSVKVLPHPHKPSS